MLIKLLTHIGIYSYIFIFLYSLWLQFVKIADSWQNSVKSFKLFVVFIIIPNTIDKYSSASLNSCFCVDRSCTKALQQRAEAERADAGAEAGPSLHISAVSLDQETLPVPAILHAAKAFTVSAHSLRFRCSQWLSKLVTGEKFCTRLTRYHMKLPHNMQLK